MFFTISGQKSLYPCGSPKIPEIRRYQGRVWSVRRNPANAGDWAIAPWVYIKYLLNPYIYLRISVTRME